MDIIYENKTSPVSSVSGSTLGITAHLHKELEIVHVLDGKAVAYADTNSYRLKKGDTFITFPNQVHYYDTLQIGCFLVFIFSADIIYGFGSEILKSRPNINFIPAGNIELQNIFEKMRCAEGKYADTILTGYLNVAMSIILPQLTLKTVDVESNSTFNCLIDFCTRNFKEDITLDLVAEKLHLSKYYISHLINRKLHQNFNEYINSLRISEACNMLKETDTKIADISEDVGFGTIRSFNRAFKQLKGVSPAEYRNDIAALKNRL